MRRAVGAGRGGAAARKFVEEEFGDAGGVPRLGKFLLLDEGVFLQPFKELCAIGRDHLRLRIMDMRIDETRHDERIAVMLDRHSRRCARSQCACGADRFDAAIFHKDNAIVDVAVTARIARPFGARKKLNSRPRMARD